MKICKRCYEESPAEIHTCTPKYSSCCRDAVVIVGGRFIHDPAKGEEFPIDRGKTYYYACKKCDQGCNLVYGKGEA